MDSSELLTTTLKWNKIHDPRTGRFSATSQGGQEITVRKRVAGGTGVGAGRPVTVGRDVQAKANIAKAAVMPLSQFMSSSYVGPKNQRLDAMISEMPVGTTISGWTKIQGKSGAYWKKGGSTSLTLGSGVAGSSVHKAIISSAVRNGSLSAKNAVKIHSGTYNNIASWAALRKILATKEIKSTTYKAIAFISSAKFTPKRKLRNEGKGFSGSKKIPRPEYGQETNYSMTGKPVPSPRLLVVSEREMMNKLSDAEKDRVNKMTGDTVVAAGSRWKKGSANGATIFQRIMQVFDNMKDYTKPNRPFLSGIKKYTHRNPVTKKERELDKGEYDEEGGMAKSQLQSIIRNSKVIYDGLEDDTNISEWAQSKITVAEDYISTVSNYMQGESEKTASKEAGGLYLKLTNKSHRADHLSPKPPAESKSISASVRKGLQTKVTEHNKKFGDKPGKRVTLSMLERVFRRGVGAYQTNRGSVRPNVTGPDQWAYARVNVFLAAIRSGRYKSGKFDVDILPKKHPLSSRKTTKESVRDYRKEYDNYHARPEQRSNRGKRNQARRKMGLKVGDPREVDHKTPLSKNGGNSSDNLRAISFSENRKKGNKTLKELVSLSFKSKGVDTSIDKYDVLKYLEAQN